MRQQCKLLGISRSNLSYQPKPESDENWRIKRLLDELYLEDPCLGTRRLVTVLARDHNIHVNRKRLQRLRREMGLEAIYCKPRTSQPGEGHKTWPYLLKNLTINRPNQVWSTDITYVPMPKGCAYLCAVMDWHSRRVLGWSLSNTMDVGLCLRAFNQAVEVAGQVPEIMNSDQGSQFTSCEWAEKMLGSGVRISMDGRGRYLDNIFIERLWRSVKYEDIYLHEYEDLRKLASGLSKWFGRYNGWRPHEMLDNKTPNHVFYCLTESVKLSKPEPFFQAA